MARRLPDGSILLSDGRIVYADSIILGQDLCEIIPLCVPPPTWPIARGQASAFFVGVVGTGAGAGAGAGGGPGGGGGGGGGSGGGVGPAGPAGPVGPQGPSGSLGTDLFAATRIVSQVPGEGTDLTLASAIAFIAASPNNGGDIYIKPGLYVEAATLVLPGDKSIIIRGAGKDATQISFPTAALALFEVSGSTGIYTFRDFTAIGDGTAGQIFINNLDSADVNVEMVNITAFQDIIDVQGTPDAFFRNCSFTMPAIAGCSFWRGFSGGELTWLNIEATLPTVSTSIISGAPDWNVTDSYVGGPGGLSTYVVAVVRWENFNLDRADVRITGLDSRIVNFLGSDVLLELRTRKAHIANSSFQNIFTVTDHIRIQNTVDTDVAEVTIVGCTFDGSQNPPLRCISTALLGGPIIDSCIFRGYTAQAILLSGGDVTRRVTVIGCRFETPGVPPVVEGPLGSNRYSDCDGFQGSIIASPTSVVDQDNYRNVRTWGALGDGAHDDTVAIQSAIDALPAAGGILSFPPGRYIVSATLNLPNKPVIIRGSGSGDAFFGSPSGSTIDLGANAIAAFSTSGAAAFQKFIFQNLMFLGTDLIGQHVITDTTGCFVTIEECQIVGFDRVFDVTATISATIRQSDIFTANSLIDGVGTVGSVLRSDEVIAFLNGPVGIGTGVAIDLTNTKLSSFGTFTVDAGALSTIVQSRLAGGTVTLSGGQSRMSAFAIDSGLVNVVSDNNVLEGGLVENAAVGISVSGVRNTVDGCRFNVVAAPITEVGAADFNLYDGINGFAGSVIIGGGSVVGTVVA